jgi:putative Ca2+/H+ antiporter (TMEM165/GDT1 family)
MDAFLVSTGLVALAEIGDRTQLLAFLLAARYKKPMPIILADQCHDTRDFAMVAGHFLSGDGRVDVEAG